MPFQTASARQIRPGSIDNTHIKAGAAIDETKLSIDWTTHGTDILSSKLLVDYVQVDDQAVVAGATNVAVTAKVSAPVANDSTKLGAVVEAGKNRVIIRDHVTGDPIIGAAGKEVYGKLSNNGTDYVVSFFSKAADGSEAVHTFGADASFDFQFPQRFDFATIAENFAANEKFVDGASDVSARLDLQQIVKDAFGADYTLAQDGQSHRGKTIIAEIAEKTTGTVNTGTTASQTIDEVVSARGVHDSLSAHFSSVETLISGNTTNISALQTEVSNARGTYANVKARLDAGDQALADEATARQNADKAIKDDLASNEAGKGAELIGIHDADNKVTATTAEGAIIELADRSTAVEGRATSLEGEVQTARGGKANLNARLDAIDSAASAEATARTNADQAIIDDLASTANGKGASKIGVEDAGGKFVAANLEGVLAEIDGRLHSVEETGGLEVEAARDSDVTGTHASLDERLEAGESRFEAVKTEVENARGGKSSLKARLDAADQVDTDLGGRIDALESHDSDKETRIQALEAVDHVHYYEDKQINGGDALVGSVRYDVQTTTFVAGNKSLQVFVNGFLQMAGVHYQEVTDADGKGIAVSFSPDMFQAGDIIQLRWEK
jgi:hypothetical protein